MAAAARTTALVGGALPSAWNGVAWYGYVNKDLRQVLGRHVGSPYELEDHIRSITAGVVGVRPIDWQNRPTFQQVVSYTGHRRR